MGHKYAAGFLGSITARTHGSTTPTTPTSPTTPTTHTTHDCSWSRVWGQPRASVKVSHPQTSHPSFRWFSVALYCSLWPSLALCGAAQAVGNPQSHRTPLGSQLECQTMKCCLAGDTANRRYWPESCSKRLVAAANWPERRGPSISS